MRFVVPLLFLLAGVVNLLPGIGVLSAQRLTALYGIPFEDPTLVVLMRHRAVLLAIVGSLLVAAAFRPGLRPAALVAGLVSMLAFVALAASAAEIQPALRNVALVDVVASLALIAAAALDRVRKAPVA